MEGLGLINVLIEATGLPPEAVERELKKVLLRKGVSMDSLTLDDVREVLASYLQEVLVEAKDAIV